ncbi:hypothetical protein [Burkholderia ubonensis]|uniref:Uncharacterized protein n=1 Tax=Burkholderia ubonensis TaxID=101571 RepID=A0A1R1JD79_9BURK|nr:hypothetical protein [Burkholderia ubonensis]OMG73129.1 hypothetical protein BW685_12975 [Burkholderia ubonensis]
MQVFDITLQANGSAFVVHAAGRYIKYTVGNAGGNDASIVVTPGMQGGSKITLQPGQAYRVADDVPVPDSWSLANSLGQAVITGKVVVGNGRIDDNSLQGTVQVVDGGKSRTLANAAYSGVAAASAVSAQYPRLQLWNPAGSGVRLVLECINNLGANTTSTAVLTDSTVALATLGQNGFPKLLGGANAAGQLRVDTNATLVPVTPALACLAPVTGTVVTSFKPVEPMVIPPGHGLLMTGLVSNDNMTATFEWYEEPNV